jgi:hypothetical protein
MTLEKGLYKADGSFVSRKEIMQKAVRDEMEVTRPPVGLEPTFDEQLKRVENLQQLQKESSLWKDHITFSVNTAGFPYFCLRPLSDMHMGAVGTDMKAIRAHLDDLKKTNIHTVMVGDIGDFFNPVKHAEGMMGDVINPDDQMYLVKSFFKEYKDKILCTVQDPSHTDWIRQVAGIEPQRYFVEGLGIPALINGGLVKLQVNEVEYKILFFHKIGRYGSSLNLTNAHKRMLDMAQDVDLVVGAHTHIGAMEKLVKRTSTATALQLGTFKIEDDFGRRQGLVPCPQVFFPTIFFDGRHKNIEMIEERDAAVEYINTLATL